MKTEVALAEALKQLMSKEELDKITVKRLSDICDIKRQTFYYHFRDIYDLLAWIFLNDNLTINENESSYEDAVRVILKYINKNKKFVKNTLSSAGKELFVQFISGFLYSFTLKQFVRFDRYRQINSDDRKFYTSYFVSGIANSIVIWAENGFKESEEVFIKKLKLVVGDFVLGIVRHYK